MTAPFVILNIRKEPYYRRAAFESAFLKLGYRIVTNGHPTSKRDVMCLWNKKAGADEFAANGFEARGGTVIVAENGYLQKVDKTYYALSVHGHNGSGWFPVGDEDRFTKLGFELEPLRLNEGMPWLVCGQRGIGSHLMASPPQWGEKAVGSLKRMGIPCRLRPHPGNSAPKIPIETDLLGMAGCVIWSSGAGVRALVKGYPVFYCAPFWVCSQPEWAGPPRKDIPFTEDMRKQALRKMSHGQWHFDEIASGEPIKRIMDSIEEAKG